MYQLAAVSSGGRLVSRHALALRLVVLIALTTLVVTGDAMGCPQKCSCQQRTVRCVKQQFDKIPEMPPDTNIVDSTELWQVALNDPYVYRKIDPSKGVSFVIHGWLDDIHRNWFEQLVQDVLKFHGGNVCAVHWGHLARFNYYRAAVDHTIIASGYLTKFVQFLQTIGVPLERITMIGHSMGAQISGQVGYILGGRIGKIYGLDPAGPCFTLPRDRGLQYRLDRSDAIYVQTIITSRLAIGVGVGEGHENFYPNGGASPQTNCIIPLTSDAEFADQIMCSHLHSAKLFRLSLNPNIVHRGKKCINWPSYLRGLCDFNKVNVLGIYSDKSGGDYYLRTSAFSPYMVHS